MTPKHNDGRRKLVKMDPKKLPPRYQAQIMKQMRQNEPERKYRNIPASRETPDGKTIRFDSKAEARRYDELMLMLKAGKIRDLHLQPEYTVSGAFTTPEGDRIRAIRYRADFSYYVPDAGGWSQSRDGWTLVVEDVKSKATKTREYAIKKKLLLERFGIEITEIE